MKRAFLTAMMVCLLIAPARAAEAVDQPVEDNTQNPHVMVATLDELQEAIAAADDGDIIELTQTVRIVEENISTEKDITIACAENFEGYSMFNVMGASVIGLSFEGGRADPIFAVTDYQGQETFFENCVFDGDNTTVAISVFGTATENSVRACLISQRVRIGEIGFLSCKAKSRSNPDGLQGFLTQSGRKICRQDGCGEMLNRLLGLLTLSSKIVSDMPLAHERQQTLL